MTAYENFIDNYSSQLSIEIKKFKLLTKQKIGFDRLNIAFNKIYEIYDTGVSNAFERFFYNPTELSIIKLTDIALSNMNRYGTEMIQIVNALEDFNSSLSKYLPDTENE